MQLKRAFFLAAAVVAGGAPSATGGSAVAPVPGGPGGPAWIDSVMARLSLREKAAQMVWPTVLGDYTPGDNFHRRVYSETVTLHNLRSLQRLGI